MYQDRGMGDKSIQTAVTNIQGNPSIGSQFLSELSDLLQNVSSCLGGSGQYKIQCAGAAILEFAKKMPYVDKMIYPWTNFNWDYLMYTQNNYDPVKMGLTGDDTITALTADIDGLIQMVNGLLFTANPDDGDHAAVNDLCPGLSSALIQSTQVFIQTFQLHQKQLSSSGNTQGAAALDTIIKGYQNTLDLYKTQHSDDSCALWAHYRLSELTQSKPYEDPFFDRPLTGQYSSSYFVMTGVCDDTGLTEQPACEGAGYIWVPNPLFKKVNATPTGSPTDQANHADMKQASTVTPGDCYRGKYAYMDNKPGLEIGQIKDFNGLIPSMINDMTKLDPGKMMAAAMGQGVPGFAMQHCKDETFIGNNINNNYRTNITNQNKKLIIATIMLWSIVIWLGWYCHNYSK